MGGFILFCIIAIPILLISFGRRKSRYGGNTQSTTQSGQRADLEQWQIKIKEEEDAARRRQAEWTKRYAASPLTQTILQTISTPSRRPDEIHIYDDHITGFTGGQSRTFDFTANRVAHFQSAIKFSSDTDFELKLFRPQVCMATAINQILGNNYDIVDKAKRTAERKFFPDGDFYYSYGYESNYVIMRLKPTRGF